MKRIYLIILLLVLTHVTLAQENKNKLILNNVYGIDKQAKVIQPIVQQSARLFDSMTISETDLLTLGKIPVKPHLVRVINKPWRLSMSAGYGMRIAPSGDLPDELVNYRNGLRYGTTIGADLSRFITPNIGLGVKYTLFQTENSSVLTNESGTYERADNIQIHYVGPFISLRSVAKRDKIFTHFDFSIGYSMYRNELVGLRKYNLRGGNFGFTSALGTDFMFTKDISMGLSLNITATSISKVKYDNQVVSLSADETENFSRIGLGLIIRYYR